MDNIIHLPTPPLGANRLLSALPPHDREELSAAAEEIDLRPGDMLVQSGAPIRYAYFPDDGFVALVASQAQRPYLALGLVGREGMLGTPLVLGVDIAPVGAVVLGAGRAQRLGARDFARALERSPALRRTMTRYVHVCLAQLVQTAACMRFHPLDARLGRWLLLCHELADSGGFHATHETLAQVLGVRRVGVTRAAAELQRKMLIRYNRGAVTVLDRAGLEAVACGCYGAQRTVYDDVMGP